MKLSVIELAGKCGVNPKTVESWECGATKPKRVTVIGLCQILECDLFDGE